MVNKKVVLICTIIAIIVASVIIANSIRNSKYVNYDQERPVARNTKNTVNVVNEIENTVEENNTQVENKNEIIPPKEETKKEIQGEEETKQEEKTENKEATALKLVQEEWGEDDSVYYTVDNHSKNIYNVSIRSKESTATVAEYEVNTETGEVNLK